MSRKMFFFIILFIVCFSHVFVSQSDTEPFSRGLKCGPYCLYYICQELGIETDLETICRESGFQSGIGTSMLGIYKTALNYGLPVVPLRTDMDGLCNIGFPSIAYVLDSHFILVTDCKKDSIVAREYPLPQKAIHKDKFKQMWSGELLAFTLTEKQRNKILSSDKKEIQGPRIAFVSTIRDFGRVDINTTLKHTFSFKNVGTENLTVNTRSTCSCTVANLSDNVIPPGGSGKIQVKYNTEGKKGVSNVKVFCRTNDPVNKITILQLLTEVEQEFVTVPDNLNFDQIIKNHKASKIIKLYKSSNDNFTITDIECPKGIIARVLPKESNDQYNHIIPVEIELQKTQEIGEFSKNIVLKTNDKMRPEEIVPVRAEIVSPVEIFPEKLIITNIPVNTSIEKEVTIKSRTGEPINLTNVDISNDTVSIKEILQNNGSECRLLLSINASQYPAIINDICNMDITGAINTKASFHILAQVTK